MGMTIDNLKAFQLALTCIGDTEHAEDIRQAIDTMRKYQKIEDIYYHQTGFALENSLREVIENGNVD